MSIKKEIFLVYPNSGSEENILYNKYVLPKRISLLTSLRAEINGGGAKISHKMPEKETILMAIMT